MFNEEKYGIAESNYLCAYGGMKGCVILLQFFIAPKQIPTYVFRLRVTSIHSFFDYSISVKVRILIVGK
jgi:hypothetical protein